MGLAVKLPYKRPNEPQLAQLYDSLNDLAAAPATPSDSPGLITGVPTLADLRKTPGDVNGLAGPPTITVAGIKAPGDNGPAMRFLWRPGSTQDDNNGDNAAGDGVIAVVGVDRGRWVRASAAAETAALAVFTNTAAGLVPPSGGGTTKFLRADETWQVPPLTPAPPGLSLIRKSILTSGTTLAKAAGTTLARAWLHGAGGGGGGVPAANASQSCAAAGGSAGAKAYYETTTIPASWPYAIGAGGTAGANTGGSGGAGGDTTFSDGTTTVTASGGPGGQGDVSSTAARVTNGPSPPAIATNGTINGSGQAGGYGYSGVNGAAPVSGAGGNSEWGGGGRARAGGSLAGANATAYGSGGSGAVSTPSGSANVGGTGFQGLIILEEWG